ncbi:HYC_CC_PP family protein [Spirosoma fluminis]
MKRALFRLFNLFMACIVLLSSTGFGLVEHSCHMRGKKKTMIVAFSEVKSPKGCSADQQSHLDERIVFKKTECCQDDHQFENVDVSSSLSQLVAKFVKTVAEAVITSAVTMLTWLVGWVFDKQSSALTTAPSPPSQSGRDIITFDRSLLI